MPFDRLRLGHEPTARETVDRAQTYGVIRATTPENAPERLVTADIALLFLTLREPGPLPEYFLHAFGAACRETLAGLVADGMLEIAVDDVYLSGPRGLAAVLGSAATKRVWRTDARSASALCFALAGTSNDIREIAAQLYAHHRIPVSAQWREQFARPADVERFLGIGARCAIEFRPVAGWYCWASPLGAATCRYKLYVSPQPGALRETVAAVVAAARYGARTMKIGGDMYGLLRPDKFVVHFATFESLAQAAERLGRELAGIRAQGVPFTAAIGSSGLLSWGVDGFGHDATTCLPMSWRQWVTLRVAEALAVAKRQAPIDEDAALSFVQRRLALDGVDAQTWSPLEALRRDSVGPAL